MISAPLIFVILPSPPQNLLSRFRTILPLGVLYNLVCSDSRDPLNLFPRIYQYLEALFRFQSSPHQTAAYICHPNRDSFSTELMIESLGFSGIVVSKMEIPEIIHLHSSFSAMGRKSIVPSPMEE